MFEKTDWGQLKAALMYLFTWDGIPCVYYGTEQGFAGGVDPKNREDMFGGNPDLGYAPWATDQDQYKLVQGLIQMRLGRDERPEQCCEPSTLPRVL